MKSLEARNAPDSTLPRAAVTEALADLLRSYQFSGSILAQVRRSPRSVALKVEELMPVKGRNGASWPAGRHAPCLVLLQNSSLFRRDWHSSNGEAQYTNSEADVQ